MADPFRNITPASGWQTSDGLFWRDQGPAQEWQNDLNFRNWCSENVCVGGEWDSRMVASAILEHWHVRSKFPSAPEGASGTQYGTSGTPGQLERISTKEPAPGRTDTERLEWVGGSTWYVGPGDFYCSKSGELLGALNHNVSAEVLRTMIDRAMDKEERVNDGLPF
jgi:hypothetical protein